MDREQSANRAWQSSAEIWPGALARFLVLALVVVAPWIAPGAGALGWLWAPTIIILACWILTPELSDRGTVVLPTVLIVVAAFALLGVIQLLPLPNPVLSAVSPLAQRWWALASPNGNEPDLTGLTLTSHVASHSISLYAWGGKQALAWIAFVTVYLLAGARFFRRAAPFSWLNAAIVITAFALSASLTVATAYPTLSWPQGVDPVPLLLASLAASIGALMGRGQRQKAVGLAGIAGSCAGLWFCHPLGTRFHLWSVPVAGAIAVAIGLLLGNLPARRLTIPAIVFAATVAPWIIDSAGLHVPNEWTRFDRAGSGFGSASLLRSDRPANDDSPASFVARLRTEGGWPALLGAMAAAWLFAESLVRLSAKENRDDRAFFAAGLFLGPTSISWLGASDWTASPGYLALFATLAGAIFGRATLSTPSGLTTVGMTLPRFLPTPVVGTALLAAVLWGASIAFAAERTRGALAEIDLLPKRPSLELVEKDLLRLRPLVHHGDALALWKLAELRILRFRQQTAKKLVKELNLTDRQAWVHSDPSEIFSRANAWRLGKQSGSLEKLRREPPVAQNLVLAQADLQSALFASPLVPEIALRYAQLRFVSDASIDEASLLDLAAERAAPYPDLLYAIGLEEFFIGRTERAIELWKATLQLSFDKLVPICRLSGSKLPASRMLESVLPNHPEAYLTYAEILAADDRNAVHKIAALEYARKSIDSADLRQAERHFHLGRWYAGVNDLPAAVAAFRSASVGSPESVRIRLALIRALELNGRKSEALDEAKASLKRFPTDEELNAVVERLRQAAVKPEKRSARSEAKH